MVKLKTKSPKTKRQSQKSKKSKKLDKSVKPALSKKEQAKRKRQITKERKKFISRVIVAGSLGFIVALLLTVLKDIKLGIAGGGAIVILALSLQYPMLALWAFLIYLPINGTVTYWIGGGSAIFQLAKDGFYLPALFTLIRQWKREKKQFVIPQSLRQPLYIFWGICITILLLVNGSQQLKPVGGDKPILLGLLGLKILLGYLPLITCAYYQIKSKKELLILTRLHVILAIVCCVLGILQYQFLLSGRCPGTRGLVGPELYKATTDAKCLVGGSLAFSPEVDFIRLPGTFVAPWQWAWFLISNAFFTFATAFSDPSLLWRFVGLGGMAVVFVNAVISGQRIALAVVPLVTVILLILTGQVANLKRFIPIAVGLSLILGIAIIANPDLIQERVDSFVSRWQASPPTDFIAEQFQFSSGQEGFLGKGIGRGTNSARIFGETKLIETYYPKLIYEIGPFGVLGFLGVVTTLTIATFKAYRSIKDRNLRSFGASFWVFILLISYNTYWYPLDTDPVAVYYWYFIGITLKLPEIDQQEQKRLAEEAAAEEN